MNRRSFWFAAAIAGVAMGALGNLPIVNLVNCVLCLWVWLGGAAAVMLYRRFEHPAQGLTTGQGARLGAVAGLIGAVLGAGFFLLTASISTPIFAELTRVFQIEGDMPFTSTAPADFVGQALAFLVIDIVLYPLFGSLGGLITANMTRAKEA